MVKVVIRRIVVLFFAQLLVEGVERDKATLLFEALGYLLADGGLA